MAGIINAQLDPPISAILPMRSGIKAPPSIMVLIIPDALLSSPFWRSLTPRENIFGNITELKNPIETMVQSATCPVVRAVVRARSAETPEKTPSDGDWGH